jgi:hypothetical protein
MAGINFTGSGWEKRGRFSIPFGVARQGIEQEETEITEGDRRQLMKEILGLHLGEA